MAQKIKIAPKKRNTTALIIVVILILAMAFFYLYGSSISGRTTRAVKPECNDRVDNDGDGLKDLSDAGCVDKRDNDETNCGDGACEGGETLATCYNDCCTPSTEICDGIDNDCDQVIDELYVCYQCGDSIDNDGDGKTDYPADPGCYGKDDNDEYNAPTNQTNSTG